MHVDNSIMKLYWGSNHFAPIDRSSMKICRQEKEFWGVSNVNTWGQASSNHDLQNGNWNTLIYNTYTKELFTCKPNGSSEGNNLGVILLVTWHS